MRRSHWIASSLGNQGQAAQTMYGAGKMALESGNHPAVLRDQVTSPGGTTIAGIGAMEKVDFAVLSKTA